MMAVDGLKCRNKSSKSHSSSIPIYHVLSPMCSAAFDGQMTLGIGQRRSGTNVQSHLFQPLIPLLIPLPLLPSVWPRRHLAEIHPQLPPMDLLSAQLHHCRLRALDIREICMRKTPRLASPPIDSDAYIRDVANFAEDVVEFAVGDVEGHVTDEEGARGFGFGEAVGTGGAG